jgi:hypothetical protein
MIIFKYFYQHYQESCCRSPCETVPRIPLKADAIEKLDWYALRWKIEMFHKVMKSGCRAKDSRLRTAARLAKPIAMMCIVAWRVLWLMMLNRTDPELPATLVLTEVEILLLDRLVPPADDSYRGTLGDVLNRLARLRGYLNRRHDGPPGPTVLWCGLTRLADIQLRYDLDHSCG